MPCEAMRGKSQAPKPSKHRPCHYDPTPPARRLQLPSATKSCLTVLLAYLLVRLLGPYPYLYMVSAAQASSSGATSTSRVSLTATPLLSLGCFSNASLGWLRGYSRWASQALLSSFSPVLSCTVLVLAFALPQWDLAPLASFLCRFAPLFAERMRKRPHARETHRILSHPILNYIKVHLTPTKCSCFLSPLWLCLTHSLFLSAVLFCANKGKRKKGASDQLSRSSTPLVTGNDLSMSMSYRLISPYFDTRQPKRLAGTAPGS